MVAAGDRPGERAGERHPERVGGGLDPAEIDEEAEIVVRVRARLPVAEGRGHVVAGHPALAGRVLRGHRGALPRPGQIGYGGGVAAREDLGVAGNVQARVDL